MGLHPVIHTNELDVRKLIRTGIEPRHRSLQCDIDGSISSCCHKLNRMVGGGVQHKVVNAGAYHSTIPYRFVKECAKC